MKIKAAIVWEKNQPFSIEEVDLAPPNADEILVKNVASGICHTDEVAQTQQIPVPLPAVLGHEGAGIVEEAGNLVTEFQKGDHVLFSYGFCGHCEHCLSGRYSICENIREINFQGVMHDGTTRLSKNGKALGCFFSQSSFATHSVVNRSSVVKVDDEVDLAMASPLGCGIQTGAGTVLNRLRPEFGSSIAVFGCGAVGMSAIMAARIAGCEKIIAVGGNAKSLALALGTGATHTVNRRECGDIPATIKQITKGGLNYAIDTTGVPDFVKTALLSLKNGGTAAVVGAADGLLHISQGLLGGGKSLTGVTEGDSIAKLFIPQLLEYHKAGRFPIDRIISYYDFADINTAIRDSHNGKVIKAVLKM